MRCQREAKEAGSILAAEGAEVLPPFTSGEGRRLPDDAAAGRGVGRQSGIQKSRATSQAHQRAGSRLYLPAGAASLRGAADSDHSACFSPPWAVTATFRRDCPLNPFVVDLVKSRGCFSAV